MPTEQVGSETDYFVCKIDHWGIKRYYNAEGQYHREYGPAIEYPNGDKEWYLNDKKITEETVRKLGKKIC